MEILKAKKLICWSTSTGPTDPTLSKNEENNITKFWPTGSFWSIDFFFLKKKENKQNKHINNKNQEAFIVMIISRTFSDFLLCSQLKIIFSKNY